MSTDIRLRSLGMVTCLADSAAGTLAALLAGEPSGFTRRDDIGREPVIVGDVRSGLPPLDGVPVEYASRNNQLLLAALQQIEAEVDAAIERFGASRVGAVIGSSTSGILEGGAAIAHRLRTGRLPDGYAYSQQEVGNPSGFLRWRLRLGGPAFTVSTACTSGAKAIISGARLLAGGWCDAVIAGGADSLCPLTVEGFSALESVSARGCNPFSRNRDGITIGEGAALFLMTRDGEGIQLSGWGESLDAHHVSAPDPEGVGAEIAIRGAMESAGLEAADIDYINLHGTGTLKNDAMESDLVHRLFGDRLPVSSTKGALGHTLGAAGAIEAGLCWLLLSRGGDTLPPNTWDGCVDPELAPLRLCAPGDCPMPAAGWRHMLSTSFAFGGSNSALVLSAQRGDA